MSAPQPPVGGGDHAAKRARPDPLPLPPHKRHLLHVADAAAHHAAGGGGGAAPPAAAAAVASSPSLTPTPSASFPPPSPSPLATATTLLPPKRGDSAGSAASTPSYMPPVHVVVAPDSEEQLNVQVLRVQNRNIWLRLKQREETIATLTERLQQAQLKQDPHIHNAAALHRAWDTLERELHATLPLQFAHPAPEYSPYLQNLLAQQEAGAPPQDEALRRRVDTTVSVVKAILAHHGAARQSAHDLCMQLRAGPPASINTALSTEIEKLTTLLREAEARAVQARTETARATAAEKRMADTLAEVRQQHRVAAAQAEELAFQVERANNQLHRLQDKLTTIRERALSGAAAQPLSQSQSQPLSQGAASESGAAAAVASAAASGPASPMVHVANKELEAELVSVRALAHARLAEIDSMKERIAATQTQLDTLRCVDMAHVQIIESDQYRALRSELDQAVTRYAAVSRELEASREELRQVIMIHKEEQDKIAEQDREHAASVASAIKDMSDDLSRVVRERDRLRTSLDQMQGGDRTGAQVKEQAEVIASLQSVQSQMSLELDRWKRRVLEGPTLDEQEKAADVAQLRAALIAAEEKQKELSNLLAVFQNAAQDTREKQELLAAEAKLKEEIEALKAAGMGPMDERLKRLLKTLESRQEDEQALLQELDAVSKAFDSSTAQNVRLLQQITSKDDTITALMNEKLRLSQQLALIPDERRAWSDRAAALQTELDKKNGHVLKLSESEKAQRELAATLQSRLVERENSSDMERRGFELRLQQVNERAQRGDRDREEAEKLRRQLETREKEWAEDSVQCRRLKENLEELKSRVGGSAGGGGGDGSDSVVIAHYKKLLTCPCCNTRQRDTIICNCQHTFCEECIRTRISTRQRKCPYCSQPFDQKGYHKLLLV